MITRSDIIAPEAETASALRARLKPRLTPPPALAPALPPLGTAQAAGGTDWDRKRISFWPVAAGLIASIACLVAIGTYSFGGGGLNAPGTAAGRPEWKLKIATSGQPARQAFAEADAQRLNEGLAESERQRRLLDARLTRLESQLGDFTATATKPGDDGKRAPGEQPMPPALLGADLGLVRSLPAARARWGRIQAGLADSTISARLTIIENGGDAAQIRLIAGPFPDRAAVMKFCQAIQAPPADCKQTAFQGQTF